MGTRFKHLPEISDEEDAAITAAAKADPDNPPISDEQLANMKPFKQVFPRLYESIQKSRGRPKSADPLKPVTVRIPQSWLEAWEEKGDDWRAQMKERLRP